MRPLAVLMILLLLAAAACAQDTDDDGVSDALESALGMDAARADTFEPLYDDRSKDTGDQHIGFPLGCFLTRVRCAGKRLYPAPQSEQNFHQLLPLFVPGFNQNDLEVEIGFAVPMPVQILRPRSGHVGCRAFRAALIGVHGISVFREGGRC